MVVVFISQMKDSKHREVKQLPKAAQPGPAEPALWSVCALDGVRTSGLTTRKWPEQVVFCASPSFGFSTCCRL